MKTLTVKLFAATILLSGFAFATPVTLTGTLSDTMCKGKHMSPNMSPAACARACVKAGAKWALVTKDKVYVLDGNAQTLSHLAGQQVRVTGEVNGDTVQVSAIAATQ